MTETLRQKQTRFALWLPRLIDKAFALGYGVTLGEAWRTPEQCAWNEEHGSGIANSLHGERLAIDLNLFTVDGVLLTGDIGYRDLGVWWKLQQPDFRWGGDIAKLKDFDHFSLSPDNRI